MPIKAACDCGKSVSVPEKFAGKRIKCPECQQPIDVPKAAVSNRTPKPASKITVKCECGKALAVGANLAGKNVKCPNCGEAVAIPTGQQQPAKQSVAASPDLDEDFGGLGDSGGLGDLLDEADLSATTSGNRCPECRNELRPDDVLCVKCGFHLDAGKRLSTKKVIKPESISLKAGMHQDTAPPKTKGPAPSEVNLVAMLLKLAGVIWGVVLIAMIAKVVMPLASGNLKAGQITEAYMTSGIYAAIFGVVIWLNFFAAKMMLLGTKLGRILGIVFSILYIPALIGILMIIKAISSEVSNYCKS